MVAHRRAGRVRLAPGAAFGVLGVAGAYAGTRLSSNIRPDLLLSLFAVLMLVAAAAMLRRRPGRPARTCPRRRARMRCTRQRCRMTSTFRHPAAEP